ncbi:DnaJ family molecular chaperone [Neomegalonema sp.]|uniref:J domain-containing protein n=1 Tax=Neomegalonema sp. TaxID=2039713 RepID=UPI0026121A65|nr:J domain-containing protein [Neomegalonema sp.]MDD2868078.1 J domain-containing protein [Neomegalonema sp.]
MQSAYRREVKIYHPDRLRGFGAPEEDILRAHERLTLLNRAYQVLAALEVEGAEEGEASAAPS